MDIWSKIVEVNIGRVDRYLRLAVGFCGLALALAVPTRWGLLGLYPLLTGMAGISPLYRLLGIRTTPAPRVVKRPPSVQA